MSIPARISCVVPTHDRRVLLERALTSVLQQTLPPAEVVVVDDLSQPDVEHTVAECARDRPEVPVRYVSARGRTQQTAGSSRNLGVAHTTGSLLAFLDDDDAWSPQFLEQVITRMSRREAAVGLSHVEYRQGEHSVLGMAMPEGLSADQCLYNPGMTGSNLVVERQAFDQVGGFDPDLWVANDVDVLVRLLDAGVHYTVVPRMLATRHSHALGHLTTKSERRAQGLETYYARYRPRMSWHQRRRMLRSIHSARRGPDHPLPQRMYHLAWQAALTSPADLRPLWRHRAADVRSLFT